MNKTANIPDMGACEHCGEVPVGHKKNGELKFARTKTTVFRSVVSKEQYREVADAYRASRKEPSQ